MMADVFVGVEGLQLDIIKHAEPVKHTYLSIKELLLPRSNKLFWVQNLNYLHSLHVVCLE